MQKAISDFVQDSAHVNSVLGVVIARASRSASSIARLGCGVMAGELVTRALTATSAPDADRITSLPPTMQHSLGRNLWLRRGMFLIHDEGFLISFEIKTTPTCDVVDANTDLFCGEVSGGQNFVF